MSKSRRIIYLKVEELLLDINNPRFAELYTGSKKQDDLVDYLLNNESADGIAKAIEEAGEFYADRPLWVINDGTKYLIRDGNRRCAAVIALQNPTKYGITTKKLQIDELPVIVYDDENEISTRIRLEHTNSLFRSWDRIAKALEVYKMYNSGNSIKSMTGEIDSKPSDLLKLANFYYEAVKIGGDDLKRLLRRGRGGTGGKTIIFERLFSKSKECGYEFEKHTYKLIITDKKLFEEYVKATITYLQQYPSTTHADVDKNTHKENFLDQLDNNFQKAKSVNSTDSDKDTGHKDETIQPPLVDDVANPTATAIKKRGSQKKKPNITRKQLPSAVRAIVDECYNLDSQNFTNAKMALTRLMFENSLKYVVDNTEYNPGKKMSQSSHFDKALRRSGKQYTNFTELKNSFQQLITNTGIRKAMMSYDSDGADQIIHNFNVEASPKQADVTCNNLIPIIEFLLQDSQDLIGEIDTSKL